MKKITITLTDLELAEITTRMKTYSRDWKILRRLRCILLRSEGKTLPQIMEALKVSEDAIASWCKQYIFEGLEAICGLKYEGRRLSVLEPHKHTIEKLVDANIYNTYAELYHAVEQAVGGTLGIKWDGFVKFCKKNFR